MHPSRALPSLAHIDRYWPSRLLMTKVVALVAVTVLVGSVGLVLANAQADARHSLEERFQTRLDLTARFVSAFADDVLTRAADVGARRLGAAPSDDAFLAVVADFGFEAAVLLDEGGRVLRIHPPRPELIGTVITERYPHLAAAVRGDPAISSVVPSAARGVPVVAFAAPYRSSEGRRVLSGAFDVSTTPLTDHLRNALPFDGGEVMLLDASDAVAASNTNAGAWGSLGDLDPDLAAQNPTHGTYLRDGEERWFTTAPVADSELRLVSSVPLDALLLPLRGTAEWLPWLLIGALGMSALYTVQVLFELHRSRAARDALARIDPLTGALTRRAFTVEVERELLEAPRARSDATLLMVDLDRFKAINDAHGHDAGDEVLRVATARMRAATRPGDIIGRWGGEEFVVLLPRTSLADGMRVAERLRASIAANPVHIEGGHMVEVTASVGCTISAGDEPASVIARADRAMYRAKVARNTVAASTS